MFWRRKETDEKSPFKLLLWTALFGLILTAVGLSGWIEDLLRVNRNALHPSVASREIVLVTIDNRSLREIGRWPWQRRRHAEMIDQLTQAGAKRIFFDVTFETRSDPANDRLLAQAIERSGRVVLPVRGATGPEGIAQENPRPLDIFSRHAQLGSIAIDYNYQNAVWKLPYGVDVNGKALPSFAASLAGSDQREGKFPVDYSIDVKTIPTVNAEAVINGRFDPKVVAGKDVIIGANTDLIGDQYFIPGVGKMGGVYIQILGAETLKAGNPVSIGWVWSLLAGLAFATLAATRRRSTYQNFLFATGVVVLLGLPIFLESNLIFIETTPALFIMAVAWFATSWGNLHRRGFVNAVSGLPNLDALRADRSGKDQALIVARVMNYAEIGASLPVSDERQLVEQIVARLSVGASNRVFYQGDGGIFAWFEEAGKPFGHHIEALYALFRNPVRVAGMSIDLAISFGVEIGSSRSLANRLGSAMLAAEEAAHSGLKWKYHDPDSLENASWKLSMLSQLDEAIDKGEVWIAFQPQLDLHSREIVAAEALARWTHPEKGPIAASEFVAAAEQHDRIGKLTDFVMDQAISAAAKINRGGSKFAVAVNLSARLLVDRQLTSRVAALLARHGLAPECLTLELTETSELADHGDSLEMLARLRELGVRVSIDDYGTGLSTLEYLKKIPAQEIKIDQSFVKGMDENRSDLLMVQSTIGLAHSLGRKVVAEGVEHGNVLEALTRMGCDLAQGFIVGRPMSVEGLMKRIGSDNSRRVA